MKVVRTDAELELPRVDRRLRETGVVLVLLSETTGEDVLASELRDADLLLTCYAQVPERLIDAAPRLKGIVKYGVGIDAIDIDLAGKTLGLIGVGRIGANVARMAGPGFRMEVLGFDPYVDVEQMARLGVEKCDDLHDMLAQSDVVSVHAVLTPETLHLLGERELACMKPSAVLVNVSRGAIVDEAALVRALETRAIAGAALDVYAEEPLAKSGHPLSALHAMDNVLLWPHHTFYTADAMRRLEDETLERCFEILEGRRVLVKSRDPRLRAQGAGVRFI